MSSLLFALRRLLQVPSFLVLLLLTLLLPPLAFRAGRVAQAPPAGYFVPATADEDSLRLGRLLSEAGFQTYDSAEALTAAVSLGQADAGVLVPPDLSLQLAKDRTDEVLTLLKAPASLQPDLWQEHAAAALFTVYAPYVTARCLEGSGISREAAAEAYYALQAEGGLFCFLLETVEGRFHPDTERSRHLFLGALALLLMLAVFFGIYEPLQKDVLLLSPRIGRAAACRRLLFPGVLCRLLLLYFAALAASQSCGGGLSSRLLLLYLLLLSGFFLLLELLPGRRWQSVLTVLLTVFSLAGCPIYTDLALFFPAVEKIRAFLPACFLWIPEDASGIGLPAAGFFLLMHLFCLFSDSCSQFIQKYCKKNLHLSHKTGKSLL